MAIGNKIDPYLGSLLRKCRENPEDEHQYKIEYLKHYADLLKENEMSVLTTVLLHLYDYDFKALQTDLARAVMLHTGKVPDEAERWQCLLYLFNALEYYAQGDYSQIQSCISSMIAPNVTSGTTGGQP